MQLEEITIGEDEKDKKKAIEKNIGNPVFLNDEHFGWQHGRLLTDGQYDSVYQILSYNGGGKKRFHYHDLKQLLRIINTHNY